MGCSFCSSDAWRLQSTNIADGNNIWGFYHRHHYIINKYSRRQQDLRVYHGYPAHSHHDKIPPWWGNVSNDKGRNMSVTKSHHTWKILLRIYMSQSTPYNNGKSRKYIIIFWGAQIFLVEKIYFGIHFQFLSLKSKTNVLSVGNKNCKLKILNQEITVNAQPIRFQWERQRAEKNQTNATNVLMHHITPAI